MKQFLFLLSFLILGFQITFAQPGESILCLNVLDKTGKQIKFSGDTTSDTRIMALFDYHRGGVKAKYWVEGHSTTIYKDSTWSMDDVLFYAPNTCAHSYSQWRKNDC